MIDSVVASYLIYRYRCERRLRIEARRATTTVASAVVVPLVLLVSLLWPWDTVAGIFSGIANVIKNAIVWVANTIAGIIVTVVNDVWNFAGDLASGISDALSFVVDIGNSAFNLLKTVWEQWLPDLLHMAGAVAQALVDTAAYYLRIAIDVVRTTVQAVVNEVANVYGWVYTNIFWPLIARVQGVFDWVWTSFVPMIFEWIHGAVAVVQYAVDHVWNAVAGVVDFFGRFGSLMVRWFTEGVHFMLYVLEHPFDWWHQIVTDAFGRGSDALDRQVTSLIERRGGDVLDGLSRWVG